ncbi:8716_t:CDS:2, partial [Funneliformis geosporum]
NWKHGEIKILLDHLQEKFSTWSKGNKSKFYNDMAKNILSNKEANAIKEAKDWYWYDKLDVIFGTRENITPSCLVNKSTVTAIAEMGQTRERIWEKKMLLEQERLSKNHELEKERLE